MSFAVAIVLLLSYFAGLWFSLKTHRDVFNPDTEDEDAPRTRGASRSSVGLLAGAGVAVGFMSEILVGSIEEASEGIGLSPFFVSLIIVAIVGNAAEHWVAVYFAARDKMDIAIAIAIGSSAQIALFVMPVLVLLSFVIGPFPLSLEFSGLEIGAILLAVLIAAHVSQDGESTWFEGVQLLAVYVVLGDRLLLRAEAEDSVLVGVGLELVLFVDLVLVRVLARGGAGAARLEGLDQLVALVLVDRRVVAEQDPLGALLLVLDQLEVDVGRVVDDQDDLGLGMEVGARTGEELVDVEAAQGRHGREATRPDRKGAVRPRPRRRAAAGRARPGARCGPPRRPAPRPRARRRGGALEVGERQRRPAVRGAAGVGGRQHLARSPRRGSDLRPRRARLAVERHARSGRCGRRRRGCSTSVATPTSPATTTTATITIGSASCTSVHCAVRVQSGYH